MAVLQENVSFLDSLQPGEFQLSAPVLDDSIQMGLMRVTPGILGKLDVRVGDGLIEVSRADGEAIQVDQVTDQDPLTGRVDERVRLLNQPLGSLTLQRTGVKPGEWELAGVDIEESKLWVLGEFTAVVGANLLKKQRKAAEEAASRLS